MENKKIKEFEAEINLLVEDFQSTAIQYDKASITAETSLFKIAKALAEMKKTLGNDGEKAFKSLKKNASKKLGTSRRNFNKAFKVAISERIRDNQHRLPEHFSVVYPLTSVSEDVFALLLADKTLTPSTTRDELAKKIKDLKPTSQSKPKSKSKSIEVPSGYLMIKSELDFNVDDESLMNELKAKLEELGWSICEPPVTLGSTKTEEIAQNEVNLDDLSQGNAG